MDRLSDRSWRKIFTTVEVLRLLAKKFIYMLQCASKCILSDYSINCWVQSSDNGNRSPLIYAYNYAVQSSLACMTYQHHSVWAVTDWGGFLCMQSQRSCTHYMVVTTSQHVQIMGLRESRSYHLPHASRSDGAYIDSLPARRDIFSESKKPNAKPSTENPCNSCTSQVTKDFLSSSSSFFPIWVST